MWSSVTVWTTISGLFATLWLLGISGTHGKDITCFQCSDEASPALCRNSVICGEGEICYTEEYKDHQGRQAFRLGCENQARCNLFLNIKDLFGKRDEPDPAPSDKCFDCCSTDECNLSLCPNSAGSQTGPLLNASPHIPMVTSPPTTVSTFTGRGCPKDFVSYKDYCYYVSYDWLLWDGGRTLCRKMGADLTSVTSKEENDFLAEYLTYRQERVPPSFWTGGFYSHEAKQFMWVDASPFNYTNWYPKYHSSHLSRNSSYYILLTNPE